MQRWNVFFEQDASIESTLASRNATVERVLRTGCLH
jgi:hypothetical protein